MHFRFLIPIALFLLTASCGGFNIGDSLPDSMKGSAAAPEVVIETDPAAETAEPVATETTSPAPAARPARIDLDPSNTDALDSERVICEAKGGKWSAAGSSGAHVCVSTTRDGNKACTRATQCEGYCLARSGTCAPFTPLYGCHEVLTDNGTRQTICLE
ncbi:hypothetical protein [Pseudoruegeria sp. HB172150]|uniref:hypothetical protein n=1 Tax=Pseudoruegeria sp. HB172150 TaxID=2721164 RepID=UPI001553A022|nr:hypothetical protein [Pseudoruegeria sp. HB172150]